MSNPDLTSILLVLLLLVGLAHLLGYLFVKLRQPRVVGEIVAGIVLGPALMGRLPFASGLMEAAMHDTHDHFSTNRTSRESPLCAVPIAIASKAANSK
jgi:uncharacterized membrane protein